jgi:hypothetical protein
MTTTFLTAFNNIIFKFIDDLISTFPEESEFKVYKQTLIILKAANAKKMCLLFKNYSYIYREKINGKDETFFINNDYTELKEASMKSFDDDSVSAIIEKLKIYWVELSNENKDKIWKYLNTMIQLSDLVT